MKQAHVLDFSILLLALFGLAACAPASIPLPTRTTTPVGTLTPYWTATQTVVRPTSTATVTLTPLPTATQTPYMYIVKKGDDMFGIALRFGLSPQVLMTAVVAVRIAVAKPGVQDPAVAVRPLHEPRLACPRRQRCRQDQQGPHTPCPSARSHESPPFLS